MAQSRSSAAAGEVHSGPVTIPISSASPLRGLNQLARYLPSPSFSVVAEGSLADEIVARLYSPPLQTAEAGNDAAVAFQQRHRVVAAAVDPAAGVRLLSGWWSEWRAKFLVAANVRSDEVVISRSIDPRQPLPTGGIASCLFTSAA